jgi:hypothetical protein
MAEEMQSCIQLSVRNEIDTQQIGNKHRKVVADNLAPRVPEEIGESLIAVSNGSSWLKHSAAHFSCSLERRPRCCQDTYVHESSKALGESYKGIFQIV